MMHPPFPSLLSLRSAIESGVQHGLPGRALGGTGAWDRRPPAHALNARGARVPPEKSLRLFLNRDVVWRRTPRLESGKVPELQ
jgi:hypothetical protein